MKLKVLLLVPFLVLSRIFCFPVYGNDLKSGIASKPNCTSPDSAGAIIGKSLVCIGDTITYSVPTIGFATEYNWKAAAGIKIVSSSNTNTVKIIAYNSGFISVEGVNACSTGVASRLDIKVVALPNVSLNTMQKLCCNYGPIDLKFYGYPRGGIWTCRQNASLIVKDMFQTAQACDPAKQKFYSLIYTYRDTTTGCVNRDSLKTSVNPLPPLLFLGGTICQDAEKILLKPYIKSPINLNAMYNVQFNLLKSLPKVGGGLCTKGDLINDEDPSLNIDFWLTVSKSVIDLGTTPKDSVLIEIMVQDGNLCYNKDTAWFVIINIPEIKFDGVPGLCLGEGIVNLTKKFNARPNSGCWTIKDTSEFKDPIFIEKALIGCDTFNTDLLSSAAIGAYRLTYVCEKLGCYFKKDTILGIHALPRVTLGLTPAGNNGRFCESDSDITLYASPAGGFWTSSVQDIIDDGKFKPSSVPPVERDKWIILTYYYINPITKCDTSKSIKVFVQSKPIVKILTPDIDTCRFNDFKLTLTANSKFTSQINWIHNFGASRASFDSNLQLSNSNPTLINFNTRSDSTTFNSVFVYTEAEGVCPLSIDTMNINIHPRPQAEVFIDDKQGCAPHYVNCNAHLTNDIDSSKAKYLWTFGEPTDRTTQQANHAFVDANPYNIFLKITSEYGCDTTFGPIPIEVYTIPVAEFSSKPRYTAMTSDPKFKFKDISKTDSTVFRSTIVKYRWDFGDISVDTDTSSSANPEYSYTQDTGKYWVTLIIETNNGCRDTFDKQVEIVPDQPFDVAIFPNPSKGDMTIEVNKSGDYSLQLFDINGKLAFEKDIKGLEIEQINRRLSKGVYNLVVKERNGGSVKKRIILY